MLSALILRYYNLGLLTIVETNVSNRVVMGILL